MDARPTLQPDPPPASADLRARTALADDGPAPAEPRPDPRTETGGGTVRTRVLRRRKRLRGLARRLRAALAEQSPAYRRLCDAEAEIEALDRILARPDAPDGPSVPAPLRQTDAAEAALRRSGVPLAIGDLVMLVREHGARVGGVRPRSTLASALSQDPRFVAFPQEGGYRWWLATEQRPAGRRGPDGRSDQDR